jgi:hypothetical protein
MTTQTKMLIGYDAYDYVSEVSETPPRGYPPVSSLTEAKVLGYKVVRQTVRDCLRPDDSIAHPGDAGYYEAQMGRLGVAPMPAGWKFVERVSNVLLCLVDGNPIALESAARHNYPRALATSPIVLNLGEIVLDGPIVEAHNAN